MKKLLALVLVLLICLSAAACFPANMVLSDASGQPPESSESVEDLSVDDLIERLNQLGYDVIPKSDGNTDEDNSQSAADYVEPVSDSAPSELTLGDTFNFDDFEITLGTELDFTKIKNKYSDHHKESVIAVPVKATNKGEETGSVNMFFVKYFGPDGTEIDNVMYYFDDDILNKGSIRPNATLEGYFHLLYAGDGDYYISFDNYSKRVEVKIPVQKPE